MIILGKESSRKIQAREKAPKARKKAKKTGTSVFSPASFNLFSFYFSNLPGNYRPSKSSLDLLTRIKIHNANLGSKNLLSRGFYIQDRRILDPKTCSEPRQSIEGHYRNHRPRNSRQMHRTQIDLRVYHEHRSSHRNRTHW